VSVTETLIGRGLLRESDGAYLMGPGGAAEFGAFGIDVGGLERRTRPLLRPCQAWSERRYHLAGSLGAVLTSALAERRWITTRESQPHRHRDRSGPGRSAEWLGIDLAKLRIAA
jgi:hypothetical protein